MGIEKRIIASYLDRKNIKHSINGYHYLISSIEQVSLNRQKKLKISDIYAKVAEEHSVSSLKVEKAIGYIISRFPESSKEFIIKAVYEIENENIDSFV